MKRIEKDYYTNRSIDLVKELDENMRFFKLILYRSFSNAEVSEISNLTLRHFIEIIPRIPYVGGSSNPLTRALIISAWFAAFSKSLRKFQVDEQEIGEISKAVADEISRRDMQLLKKKARLASHRILRPIRLLRPFLQGFMPATPKLQRENFVVTYVNGGEADSTYVDFPNSEDVMVTLAGNLNEYFRHTYKISYWNQHFSGLEMVTSTPVAVTA